MPFKYQVDMPKTLVTYVPCDVFKAPTMLHIHLVGSMWKGMTVQAGP